MKSCGSQGKLSNTIEHELVVMIRICCISFHLRFDNKLILNLTNTAIRRCIFRHTVICILAFCQDYIFCIMIQMLEN